MKQNSFVSNKPRAIHSSIIPVLGVYWRNLLLVCLIIIAIGGVYLEGIRMDMHVKNISWRYVNWAVPIALSNKVYGHPKDYVGYAGIVNSFQRIGGSLQASNPNIREFIKDKSNLDLQDKREFPWGVNDLGLIDFATMAFYIFGISTESLYYFYFLILATSVLSFVFCFFKSCQKLVLLIFSLCSVYVTLFVLGIVDTQFGNINDARSFGILSMVPLLHILFTFTDREPINLKSIFFLLIQTLILIFVYFCRSSLIWQIACILLSAPLLFYLWVKNKSLLFSVRKRSKIVLNFFLPIVIILIGLVFLNVYKRTMFHPEYFKAWGGGHQVWHNLLMGVAYHPELSKRYKIPIASDPEVDLAAARFYREKGNTGRYRAEDAYVSETVKRDLYFDIWAKYPLESLALNIWYKPKALFKLFLWTTLSLPEGEPYLDDTNSVIIYITPGERNIRDLFYNPFRWEAILLVLLAVAIGYKELCKNKTELIVVPSLVFLFSLINPLVVYPVIFVLAEVFVTTTAFIYTLITALIILSLFIGQKYYSLLVQKVRLDNPDYRKGKQL